MTPAVLSLGRALAFAGITTLVLGCTLAADRLALAGDAPIDDDAVVSSDGRTLPPAPTAFTSSLPFAGTGVLPEGARVADVLPSDDLRPMEAFSSES